MRIVEKVRIRKHESIAGGLAVRTFYIVEYAREKNLFQKVLHILFGYESWTSDQKLIFYDFREASVCAHTLRGKEIVTGFRSTIL